MVEIRLGKEWDWETGREGKPVTVDLESNFELVAPPGAGKGATLEIPNLLLGLRGSVSVLSIDPSGQNAAVCAEARRTAAKNAVLCLNPFGLHVALYPDLQSAGCNPMPRDWRSSFFYQDCAAVGEALIKLDNEAQRHFPESARGLITGLIMWEVLKAAHEGRAPLLENVRSMLCEAETKEAVADDATDEEKKLGGKLKSGLRFHAGQMIASGHWQISDLAGRFIKEGSREIDSIISTARTQTEWLLSEPMRSDLRKDGVDWARLAEEPTTVFLIVPSEFLETQEGSVWLRLQIMAAMRVIYRLAGSGKVKEIVLMLSEFAALGKLTKIEGAKSQGRKFGVRLWFVLQDIHQLDIYGPKGADSFAGQCQAVFAFAPGDWLSAEWMSKRSGEEDVITVSASESDDRSGVNRTYHTQRQRCWPPEKILSLPEFHGLVWFHGQSQAVPVYAAPYWEIAAAKRLARPDPYHASGAGKGSTWCKSDSGCGAAGARRDRRRGVAVNRCRAWSNLAFAGNAGCAGGAKSPRPWQCNGQRRNGNRGKRA